MAYHDNLTEVDFSPDGALVAAALMNCEAIVREVASGRAVGAPMWTGFFPTLASFHPDGRHLLTGVMNEIQVWTFATEMKRADVPLDDPEEARLAPYSARFNAWAPDLEKVDDRWFCRRLALSPDGRRLVHYDFGRGSGLEMIDAQTFGTIYKVSFDSGVSAVYWRPDNREIVTTTNAWTAVYNAVNGATKFRFGHVVGGSGSFRPDGKRFAVGTQDYNLVTYDTETWKTVGPILPHTSAVNDSTYSRDGKIIITADAARTTRLWHAATGKRIGR